MSKTPLKILFLASWYPNKGAPTLGNFIQRHAEAVATQHAVTVLYVCLLEEQNEAWRIEESTVNGVKTIIVYGKKGGFRIWKKWQGFKKGVAWLDKKNHFDFDVVHQNVIWPDGWQAAWLKRKFALPFIITEHWTGYDKSVRNDQPYLLKPFSKWVVKRADVICPVTQNLTDVMQKFGLTGNYKVIPNVVDTSIFHPGQKPSNSIEFLHVSSLLDAHKNISGILRVWKKISDQFPQAHLSIGGDGDVEALAKKIEELEILESSITIFGEKTWHEIAAMMSKSHTLILFSNYENLPCVIVEAMASGMNIISTDVGGIREHVNHERGILVSSKNETALEKAIITVIQQPTKFNIDNISNYGRSKFSQAHIADLFTQAYLKAISKK
jgi:glycosyltransferase involved in cell wall biosynthesis